LLGRLFSCRRSCGCASACEPSCGCADGCAAAPNCCSGGGQMNSAAPVVQPTPVPAEAAPAAPVDPSASAARKVRARNASHVIRFGR
jgi:hypothetical protein